MAFKTKPPALATRAAQKMFRIGWSDNTFTNSRVHADRQAPETGQPEATDGRP
jgi:hypothetical protein